MSRYRLGVLDQSPVAEGRSPRQSLEETLELAKVAEALGYERFWVAEHHSGGSFAGTCPTILATRIASLTSRIRVGTGGIMLMHASALRTAEQALTLDALFPGRIDVGIGRAPGAMALPAAALTLDYSAPDLRQEHYASKLRDLDQLFSGPLPAGHPHAGVFAQPLHPGGVEPWLLGSGHTSAKLAAELGWGFCFAQFISGPTGMEVVDNYRAAFRPSRWLAEPRVSVAAYVVAADTDEEAAALMSSTEMWFLRRAQGHLEPFPPPEVGLQHPWSEAELEVRGKLRALRIRGGPDRVRRLLDKLVALYETNELMIVSIAHDHRARIRSYEIMAELARD